MWGCGLKASLADLPARSTMRAKPAVVNGAPRSDVNTNRDLWACSRWMMGLYSNRIFVWLAGLPQVSIVLNANFNYI
jgi:hypothetical protein